MTEQQKPAAKPKQAKPAAKKKTGRHTIISPEIQEAIVTSIRLGNYIEHAAATAGISKSTFWKWMERGKREKERIEALEAEPRPDETPFVEFMDAVERAKAEAVARNIGIIQKAAQVGSWQAAAWWLERTQPTLYGRKQQVALEGVQNGSPIAMSVDTKDLEDKVSRILQMRDGN